MSFKSLDASQDIATLNSSINEVVTISSSIYANNLNVKFFSNIASGSTDLGGYWETIYDSSPTSSLSTALFDVTYGYATGSAYNLAITVSSSQNQKIKIYRDMANVLLGDPDAQFTINNATQKEAIFLLVKRSIQKDEIKKGATQLVLNQGTYQLTASDPGSVVSFKQGIGGDYAPLLWSGTGSEVGQVWYQAGIVVLPTSLSWPANPTWSGTKTIVESQSSSSINQLVDGFRNHTEYAQLHSQTNLFSTVIFCRAFNTEFNYSSNPSYVDDSKRIRVTSGSNIIQSRTYITTIGLYDTSDNLLAVAKISKPISKSADQEFIGRIRLDY